MAVVLIMTVWNGLDQVSPDVCITAAPAYLLQLVLATVSIHHLISAVIDSFQKAGRIFSCPRLCVVIQDDRGSRSSPERISQT